jgi:tetratricopeptide (TPR) repeat protein
VIVLALGMVLYRVVTSGESSLAAEMRRAQAQVAQGDYSTGMKSLSDLIEAHPRSKAPRLARLEAAMAWVRNYHILGADDKAIAAAANTELSHLMAVMEGESAGVTGKQAADLSAHLGWAHFLRYRFAETDVPESAEPYLRQALRLDANNVYANAMLGNFLLQTNSDALTEAMRCFHAAVDTGQERAWVRSFELGGLMSDHDSPAQRELAKLVNEMRKNGEPIDGGQKHRILAMYTPTVARQAELANVLSAVPSNETWATYVWLDENVNGDDPEWQELKHTFILANIDELAGRTGAALALYRQLAQNPRVAQSSLAPRVADAARRLQTGAGGK